MRRARLWSYLGWQARDFAVERGAPLLIVATLMTFPIIMGLREMRQTALPNPETAARYVILAMFSQFSFIAVLVGINGVVSNDRVRGYYRFLFAKPVSIPRYYGQAFIINGLGLLAATAGMLGVIYALGYPLFPARVLLMSGLVYVALGGLGFLYSTVARFDWVLMGATLGVAHVLRVYPSPDSRAGKVINVILPPFDRLQKVGLQLAHGEAAEPAVLAWLLGWGIAGFLLGLLILRRRSLAS